MAIMAAGEFPQPKRRAEKVEIHSNCNFSNEPRQRCETRNFILLLPECKKKMIQLAQTHKDNGIKLLNRNSNQCSYCQRKRWILTKNFHLIKTFRQHPQKNKPMNERTRNHFPGEMYYTELKFCVFCLQCGIVCGCVFSAVPCSHHFYSF